MTKRPRCLSTVAKVAVITAVLFVAGACAAPTRMGDPIKADPKTAQQATTSAQPHQQGSKENKQLDKWAQKWIEIQSADDKVGWVDHFRVCALKYRYRNYDELFRCLDLFETKVAQGGKRVGNRKETEAIQRATPVLTGWMRASAYSELGEADVALKWAESAWAALPAQYRGAFAPGVEVEPQDRVGFFTAAFGDYHGEGFFKVTTMVAGETLSEDNGEAA
jgi:hypothetical protein